MKSSKKHQRRFLRIEMLETRSMLAVDVLGLAPQQVGLDHHEPPQDATAGQARPPEQRENSGVHADADGHHGGPRPGPRPDGSHARGDRPNPQSAGQSSTPPLSSGLPPQTTLPQLDAPLTNLPQPALGQTTQTAPTSDRNANVIASVASRTLSGEAVDISLLSFSAANVLDATNAQDAQGTIDAAGALNRVGASEESLFVAQRSPSADDATRLVERGVDSEPSAKEEDENEEGFLKPSAVWQGEHFGLLFAEYSEETIWELDANLFPRLHDLIESSGTQADYVDAAMLMEYFEGAGGLVFLQPGQMPINTDLQIHESIHSQLQSIVGLHRSMDLLAAHEQADASHSEMDSIVATLQIVATHQTQPVVEKDSLSVAPLGPSLLAVLGGVMIARVRRKRPRQRASQSHEPVLKFHRSAKRK